MRAIRCAVFGAGHFGRYHAQKYAALPGAELVAVVDPDADRARALAAEVGTRAATSIDEVEGSIEAASVAVPTHSHHDVATRLLEAGIHVLIEKPIAETIEQADALVALAAARGRILQVGHLQRFLLRRMEVSERVFRPLYIEATRIAPFKPRGTDVGVVLDLMIHDIDLILALVQSPVLAVDAVGAPVVTTSEDLVNARLRFANGCVATATASRIGFKTERRLRIFQPESYISIDLAERRMVEIHRGEGPGIVPGLPGIARHEATWPDGDDLMAEIADFVDCVREGRQPLVTGADGRRALETAMRVTESLSRSLAAAGFAGLPAQG
ncbi:MAG: Gfo/Idh/MocA family oxidoreductase [Alphaproteobacteria bacterium]|nr:Gfo/Idh/MocA family oxidoreductase [Alphaproteobacteria bacterium]MBM3628141.1 Gfo/Idh/MocA family oxidoreductase [Alphaproteobacteria bacterium]